MVRTRQIEIYDTTLRDGAQKPGVSFSVRDKLGIVRLLDKLGMHFIEAGWPGANDTDTLFFRKLKTTRLKKAQIVAFGMTCKKGKVPEEDKNLKLLLESGAKIITLVGKSCAAHVEKVLNADLNENLRMIRQSCAFLTKQGRDVLYDAEHFFDGFKENPVYAIKTLKAAIIGKAQRVVLCDTNGGALPLEICRAIDAVKREIDVPLGIHAHNDMGLAVANSLTAFDHGVLQLQGTINGYGERCGNANLCILIPILQLKKQIRCIHPQQIVRLTEISRVVSEIANLPPSASQPFTGYDAFRHKAGLHAHAQGRCPWSYQHMDPALIGNRSSIIVSDYSGRANVKNKAEEFGIKLTPEQIIAVLDQVEKLKKNGFHLEGADGSLELLMLRIQDEYASPFSILVREVRIERRGKRKQKDEAIVKIKIGRTIVFKVAEGNGPVNALDNVMREALSPFFPKLKKVRLIDYKVRTLSRGKKSTSSSVRVLIDFSNGENHWTTVGCSSDVVDASCQALADGLKYAIVKFS